jgi:chitin synthase
MSCLLTGSVATIDQKVIPLFVSTAHIFFDDAFEISDVNDDWAQVNRFVKLLVSTIDEAATHVHETHIRIKPPVKYPTPYGGRLVWTLPGKTKMIAHLKDKAKIRHRKRWSQVGFENTL